MIERPYLIGDILHIDREPVLKLLPTVRATMAARVGDLFIGDPKEMERLEEELQEAERYLSDALDALCEVVRLLKEDKPHAARQVAEKALGDGT